MELLIVLLIGAAVIYFLYKKMHSSDGLASSNSAAEPVTPMPEPQPAPTVPVTVGTTALPEGWASYTPAEKIAFFNANNITEEQMLAHGISSADIAWMRDNGYTVGLAKPASEPVVPAVVESKKPARKAAPKKAAVKKPVVKDVPAKKPAARKSKK